MSTYGITSDDIYPDRISEQLWTQIVTDPSTGSVAAVADIVAVAEADFAAFLGGDLTAAANIALAKPRVVDMVLYHAHMRRAQHADYTIPQSVQDMYQAARKWAADTGQALLAGEGGTAAADRHTAVKYDQNATSHFKRSQTDLL